MLIWLREEPRDNETRTPLTPEGAQMLAQKGWRVVVEDAQERCFATSDYAAVGCEIAPRGSWTTAPDDAIVLGLKELPDDGTALRHRHVMFGHAFKGQSAGPALLERFKRGGGVLYDLEYLVDDTGRRVAAFGYWAGFAGAALSMMALSAQHQGVAMAPLHTFESARAMTAQAQAGLTHTPTALIIGALGRVGRGAADLCRAIGVAPTQWDMAETAHGGPFPQVLEHDVFLNCILAQDGVPVFVPRDAGALPRRLTVIGDIACDPDSAYNPVPVYSRATTWDAPVTRVHDAPPLDVMAIDNLPSLLPRESSEDFAAQLLPHLAELDDVEAGTWGRAAATFRSHIA